MQLRTICGLRNIWKYISSFCAVFLMFQVFKNCKSNFGVRDFYEQYNKNVFREPYFPLVKEFSVKKSKKFVNENARKVGFELKFYPNITLKNSERKVIFLATTYFSEWNPWHYYFLHFGNKTFQRYKCPVYNCYVTKNKSHLESAAAVLFHVRDLEIFSISNLRKPNQIWILYSMEPPWLEIKDLRRFEGVFNWTMSYRRGSDFLLSYGFIGKRASPVSKRMVPMASKQNKAVWFASNCRTDSNREEYIKRLQMIYPVDVIGGCGSDACRPAETKRCYAAIASQYKFYLSFENAICRDYVTEKVFNPLEYYIVPVTFGGADYSKIIPKHSYINAMQFESPEDLGDHLWNISKNDTEYLSYFAWKKHYRSYLQPWMCDLCARLHEKPLPQVKYNLDDWWHEGYSCLRWSNNGFVPIKHHAFPVYHTKNFA